MVRPSRRARKKIVVGLAVFSMFFWAAVPAAPAAQKAGAFFFRGAFYLDWMGFKSGGDGFYNRLSTRLDLELWNRPGNGWTIFLDARDRFAAGNGGGNQLLLYESRLAYDSPRSRLFLSLGQMNLYDTAGIGQLAGALAGYKFGSYLAAGAYGGLATDLYAAAFSKDYQKYGCFARYIGPGAKQFSLSYNLVRFKGMNERQFIYSDLLLPLGRTLFLYGNGEFELGGRVAPSDRLSRLFVNARVNLTRFADLTASYSSGRGMDYHRFLLEQSQDPVFANSEIVRFYYSLSYGVRLSVMPLKNLRLHVSRQESELRDAGIRNHTTGFGFSLSDILASGISLYGNYDLNRGDASEADTYYLSASRSFGKLSWTLSFANFYNGVRIDAQGTPQVVRSELPDQQTFTSDWFLAFNRTVAVALDYSYMRQPGYGGHQFFVRLILRK